MYGERAVVHESVPPAEEVWATSPTTVKDFVGARRMSARQLIAECSCASSTTTWP